MNAGLILAAGESRRMGRPKALLTLGGETFVDRLTGLFSEFCGVVIVVAGAHADAIGAGARRTVSLVYNPDWAKGQITSMQAGLRAVPAAASRVLFTLVDHPNVQRETVRRVLESDAEIAIPRAGGRRGHPISFAAALIPEFLAVPETSSAREVLARHAIEYIDVNDEGILEDIDDPAAYRRILASERA